MAFILDDISATIREKFFPVAVENVFKKIFLFYRLMERNKITPDGPGPDGRILQPIVADKYPIYSHDNRYGKLNVPVKNILTTAEFRFSTLYGALPLTREDEMILRTKEAVIKTLSVRFHTMVTSLIEDIEKRLFQQLPVSEGVPMDSFQKIIDNGDNYPAYAGISRVDFSDWKAFVLNKNNTSVTYEDLSMVMKTATRGTEAPTIVFTTDELWTKINTLIYDKQRYVLQDTKVADLGIPNFKIMGAVCVSSDFMPPGTIWFVNENYLQMVVKKDADKNGMSLKDYAPVDMSTVQVMQLFFDGQLFSPSPRMHAAMINVAA